VPPNDAAVLQTVEVRDLSLEIAWAGVTHRLPAGATETRV